MGTGHCGGRASGLRPCRRWEACAGLRPPGNPGGDSEWISSTSLHPTLEPDEVADSSVREVRQQCDERTVRLDLPDGIEDLVQILRPWWDSPLRLDLPPECHIPGVGLQYLAGGRLGWHDDIDQIHIYTDGSYSSKDQIAAGAFVIFGTVGHHERRSFLGWKGGTIITDSNSPHFTAAREHLALEAEASALVWAHIWMLQSGLCLPFNFYFDSCAAGNAASGIWSCNPCWPQGGRLRELVQFSCGLRGSDQLRYEHVKAHSNQPCNEIADSIAKFSAQLGSQDFEGLPAWRSFFDVGDTRLSWGWWFIKSAKKGSGLPAIGSEVQVWTTTDRHHLPTTKIRDLVNQETDVEKRSDMWLSLATLNVQTLSEYSPDEVPGGEHWRAALLREQLEARGVQVAGLQETRARDKLLIATSNFIRIIGGNPEGNGHHGCELWLSSTTPLGKLDDKVVMFGRDTVTVLCAEARLLVVRAQPAGLSFVFVVCHMPHEGTDQDIKDLWRTKLKDALDRYSRLGFCFILGDFNARIDIMNPPFVGARLNGEGSDNGDRMRTLVEDSSMWLPSTFDEWHSGNDWTWTHARGTHARLDYIVAPFRDDVSVCYSYVDYDMQLPILHRDHELVRLDVRCTVTKCIEKRQKRRAYDWDKMATPQGREQLRKSLSSAPQIGWDIDVHQHWQHLEDFIHLQLETHFPKPKRPKRHSIFSPSTWQSLDRRRNFKKSLLIWDEAWISFLQKWAISAWRTGESLREGVRYVRLQLYTLILAYKMLLNGFRDAAWELKCGVKQNKAAFVDQVASQAQMTHGMDIFYELKKLRIGSKFRKRGPTTLPGFGGVDDCKTSDQIWADHCSKMEAAVSTSTSRLLQRCRIDGARRLEEFSVFDHQHVPTLLELEASFRRIKPHKAGGIDDLKSDLYATSHLENCRSSFIHFLSSRSLLFRSRYRLRVEFWYRLLKVDSGVVQKIIGVCFWAHILARQWEEQ